VARRLRSHGLAAGTVTLKARYPDFTTVTRAETLVAPTNATVALRDTARSLLERKLDRGGRPLRLLGVTASKLTPQEAALPAQGELFGDGGGERERTLDRIVDKVHDRYGAKLRRGLTRRR